MKKKLIIGLCALLALALLIPTSSILKDGGTRVYQALLYRVELVHRLDHDSESGYQTGTVVSILGREIFNSVD